MIEWIVTSSAMILIIIALRGLLKGKISLKLQYGLWALVLIRLLLPFSILDSAISISNVLSAPVIREADDAVADYETAYQSAVQRHESSGTDYTDTEIRQQVQQELFDRTYEKIESQYTQTGAAVPQVQIQAEAQQQVEVISLTAVLTEALPSFWIAGMIVVAVALIGSNLHFWWKLRQSRKALDISGVPLKVYLTDYVATPCLFGFGRPDIYLTNEVMADSQMRRHVIAHEMSHYRQGDHIWSVLRCVCLVLHWYNPLVWAAAVLSKQDAELACDEATIQALGESERTAYGRTLIGMTCVRRDPGGLMLTATTMLGTKKTLKERIALIAKKPTTALYTLIACILVVSLAVGCTFTGAPTEPTDPAEPSDSDNTVWNQLSDAVDAANSAESRHFSFYMLQEQPGDVDLSGYTPGHECWEYGDDFYLENSEPSQLYYDGTFYARRSDDSWLTDRYPDDDAYGHDVYLPSRNSYTVTWTQNDEYLNVVLQSNGDENVRHLYRINANGKLLWYAEALQGSITNGDGTQTDTTLYAVYVFHDTAPEDVREKVETAAAEILSSMVEGGSEPSTEPTEPLVRWIQGRDSFEDVVVHPYTPDELQDAVDVAMGILNGYKEKEYVLDFQVHWIAFDPVGTDYLLQTYEPKPTWQGDDHYPLWIKFAINFTVRYDHTLSPNEDRENHLGYIMLTRDTADGAWVLDQGMCTDSVFGTLASTVVIPPEEVEDLYLTDDPVLAAYRLVVDLEKAPYLEGQRLDPENVYILYVLDEETQTVRCEMYPMTASEPPKEPATLPYNTWTTVSAVRVNDRGEVLENLELAVNAMTWEEDGRGYYNLRFDYPETVHNSGQGVLPYGDYEYPYTCSNGIGVEKGPEGKHAWTYYVGFDPEIGSFIVDFDDGENVYLIAYWGANKDISALWDHFRDFITMSPLNINEYSTEPTTEPTEPATEPVVTKMPSKPFDKILNRTGYMLVDVRQGDSAVSDTLTVYTLPVHLALGPYKDIDPPDVSAAEYRLEFRSGDGDISLILYHGTADYLRYEENGTLFWYEAEDFTTEEQLRRVFDQWEYTSRRRLSFEFEGTPAQAVEEYAENVFPAFRMNQTPGSHYQYTDYELESITVQRKNDHAVEAHLTYYFKSAHPYGKNMHIVYMSGTGDYEGWYWTEDTVALEKQADGRWYVIDDNDLYVADYAAYEPYESGVTDSAAVDFLASVPELLPALRQRRDEQGVLELAQLFCKTVTALPMTGSVEYDWSVFLAEGAAEQVGMRSLLNLNVNCAHSLGSLTEPFRFDYVLVRGNRAIAYHSHLQIYFIMTDRGWMIEDVCQPFAGT